MPPANIRFGGGAPETVLHPIVMVALILAILLIWLLPRKYMVVPFLAISMLTPWGQELYVAGVHLTAVRIVVLFAWARILVLTMSSRLRPSGGFNSIDTTFSLWAFFYAFAFVVLWWQLAALINRFGFLLDAFGIYFLLRFLIQDEDDVRRAIKTLAYVSAIIAIAMVAEQFTRWSIFGLLGGVALNSELRDSMVRSHGVFQHPILAGTFGATILALFLGLRTKTKSKLASGVGIVAATVIVITSSSSTPLMTYAAVVGALCLWPMRKYMRMVRWGLVFGVVAIQLVMKADIWWLISHVNVAGGSSYHRAALVDNLIAHFGDWWLLGSKHYYAWGWDMWDVSNEFCSVSVNAGLAGLVAFIAMISRGFGKLGSARKRVNGDRKQEWFLWCLGAALFGHVVAFFGTAYWDQTQVAWFALLALISTSAYAAKQPKSGAETITLEAEREVYEPVTTS